MPRPSEWPETLSDEQLAHWLASSALNWIELTRNAAGAVELLEEYYEQFDTRPEKRGSKWLFVPDPAGLTTLCKLARGRDPIAHRVILKKAALAINEGRPVPAEISSYVVDVLRASRLPTRGRPPNLARDLMIADAVSVLETIGGYQRYRGTTSTTVCACSIVVELLAQRGEFMEESRVAEIAAERLGPVRGK